MYFDDHNPPHFHARYSEFEAMISIHDFSVIEGYIPSRALGLVVEWASLHQKELLKNWELVKNNKLPLLIEPLK